MVVCNYHWLNSASRVLISTCSAPLVQMGERKQFSQSDLDLWHTTLTYNARVKVDSHAKNQGQMSNGLNRRVPTDKRTHTHTHTHGCYQMYYLPCYAVDNKGKNSQPRLKSFMFKSYCQHTHKHQTNFCTLPLKQAYTAVLCYTGKYSYKLNEKYFK